MGTSAANPHRFIAREQAAATADHTLSVVTAGLFMSKLRKYEPFLVDLVLEQWLALHGAAVTKESVAVRLRYSAFLPPIRMARDWPVPGSDNASTFDDAHKSRRGLAYVAGHGALWTRGTLSHQPVRIRVQAQLNSAMGSPPEMIVGVSSTRGDWFARGEGWDPRQKDAFTLCIRSEHEGGKVVPYLWVRHEVFGRQVAFRQVPQSRTVEAKGGGLPADAHPSLVFAVYPDKSKVVVEECLGEDLSKWGRWEFPLGPAGKGTPHFGIIGYGDAAVTAVYESVTVESIGTDPRDLSAVVDFVTNWQQPHG